MMPKAQRPLGDLPATSYDLQVPGPEGDTPRLVKVIVGYKDDEVFEVFIRECPGDQRALANACARLVSCWLQAGGNLVDIIGTLRGQASVWQSVRWCRPTAEPGIPQCLSIADAVGRLLEELVEEG